CMETQLEEEKEKETAGPGHGLRSGSAFHNDRGTAEWIFRLARKREDGINNRQYQPQHASTQHRSPARGMRGCTACLLGTSQWELLSLPPLPQHAQRRHIGLELMVFCGLPKQ